jgi:hypothetical protein
MERRKFYNHFVAGNALICRTLNRKNGNVCCLFLLLGGDLNRLGSGERNSAKPKARKSRANGRERVHVRMRAGVEHNLFPHPVFDHLLP